MVLPWPVLDLSCPGQLCPGRGAGCRGGKPQAAGAIRSLRPPLMHCHWQLFLPDFESPRPAAWNLNRSDHLLLDNCNTCPQASVISKGYAKAPREPLPLALAPLARGARLRRLGYGCTRVGHRQPRRGALLLPRCFWTGSIYLFIFGIFQSKALSNAPR